MPKRFWLKDLFSFCADHNLKFQDDCTPLQYRTQNDCYIMEEFLPHYDASDLKKLNHCQNSLQVITLSDISTANGTHLESAMVTGQSLLHPRSRLTWPNTPPQLPRSYWQLWSRALRHCFTTTNNFNQLRQPLRNWNNIPSDWKWIYSPTTDRVYQSTGIYYSIWTIIPTRTHTKKIST